MSASMSQRGLNVHQFRECDHVWKRGSLSLGSSVEQGLGASGSGNASDSVRERRPAVLDPRDGKQIFHDRATLVLRKTHFGSNGAPGLQGLAPRSNRVRLCNHAHSSRGFAERMAGRAGRQVARARAGQSLGSSGCMEIPPALWATGGLTMFFFPLPKKPLFPSGRGTLPLPSQGFFGGFATS